eukprot:1977687-Rhodomonas_salina.3
MQNKKIHSWGCRTWAMINGRTILSACTGHRVGRDRQQGPTHYRLRDASIGRRIARTTGHGIAGAQGGSSPTRRASIFFNGFQYLPTLSRTLSRIGSRRRGERGEERREERRGEERRGEAGSRRAHEGVDWRRVLRCAGPTMSGSAISGLSTGHLVANA